MNRNPTTRGVTYQQTLRATEELRAVRERLAYNISPETAQALKDLVRLAQVESDQELEIIVLCHVAGHFTDDVEAQEAKIKRLEQRLYD